MAERNGVTVKIEYVNNTSKQKAFSVKQFSLAELTSTGNFDLLVADTARKLWTEIKENIGA